MKGRLITLALGLVTSLLLGELLARAYSHTFLNYDVEMLRYAQLLKQYASDNNLITHRANKQAQLMGVSIRTDEQGRRLSPSSLPKEPSQKIKFFGDSVTLGWGVSDDAIFPDRIATAMNQKSPTVLENYAVGNYNLIDVTKALKQHCLTEDRCVWAFYINDIELEGTSQHLTVTQHSYLLTMIRAWLRQITWGFTGPQSYAHHYEELWKKNYPEIVSVVKTIGGYSKDNDIDLRVILLPDLNSRGLVTIDQIYQETEELLKQNDLPVLNLQKEKQFTDSKFWVSSQDAHPNAEVHTHISNAFCKTWNDLCLSQGDY